MVKAIIKEIDTRKNYLDSNLLSSIYFGGGTPSILTKEQLGLIFNSITKHFKIDSNTEITFEANPEDITYDNLCFWNELGINRLSIGIQSFHQEDLTWMNRIHNVDQSIKALDLVDDFGKLDYSMDLIFGSESTSNKNWETNLQMTIDRKPSHISCYALTVEENTALHHHVKKGTKKESPQQKIKSQFYLARKFLQEAGYEHYEISNYSLPGKNAVHNSNYWASKSYLGIGPAAHSYNGISRSWNLSNNIHYIKAIAEHDNAQVSEQLTETDKYNEFIMTRLRTKWGINKKEILQNFNAKYNQYFNSEVQSLIQSKLIIENKDSFTLSESALIIADRVSSELFY